MRRAYDPLSIEPNARPLVAGVVTYNQYDMASMCADRLLGGDRRPDRIVIVDNGGTYESPFGHAVTVIRPEFNLGYAGAINAICDWAPGCDVMILNDDIRPSKRTVSLMAETPGWFVTADAFALFLMRPAVLRHIGRWWQSFWPMGPEDQDYCWRLFLARSWIPGDEAKDNGMVRVADPEHEHIANSTGTTIGQWADALRSRGDNMLLRRWGARPEEWHGPGYRFTNEKPVLIDELALFVDEGVSAGHLPAKEILQAWLGGGVQRIAQVPGKSMYWGAAAALYAAPGADLYVCRPLAQSWPMAWAIANGRVSVHVIDHPDELQTPVDLMIVDEKWGMDHTGWAHRIVEAYMT